MTDVLELVRGRVDDLHVGGEITITVDLGELVECLVGNITGRMLAMALPVRWLYLRNVQLVVTDGEQIIVEVLENGIGNVSIWRSSIRQTSTIVQVTSIDK